MPCIQFQEHCLVNFGNSNQINWSVLGNIKGQKFVHF